MNKDKNKYEHYKNIKDRRLQYIIIPQHQFLIVWVHSPTLINLTIPKLRNDCHTISQGFHSTEFLHKGNLSQYSSFPLQDMYNQRSAYALSRDQLLVAPELLMKHSKSSTGLKYNLCKNYDIESKNTSVLPIIAYSYVHRQNTNNLKLSRSIP